MWEMVNAYNILVGKLEQKRVLEIRGTRSRETDSKNVDWSAR
jgi:hypothetical protein